MMKEKMDVGRSYKEGKFMLWIWLGAMAVVALFLFNMVQAQIEGETVTLGNYKAYLAVDTLYTARADEEITKQLEYNTKVFPWNPDIISRPWYEKNMPEIFNK